MNKHEFALLAALEKGPVSSQRELAQLAGMVDAAILGKAIYAGRLDLARCVAIGGPQE